MADEQMSPRDLAAQKELQEFLAVESQKARFQQQVHTFTDMCWDKCIGKIGNRLDRSEESCLSHCVERFLDVQSLLLKRLESHAG